jgi:hypothetical protein
LNEKSTMRLSQRLIAATVVVALSVVLAGCSNLGSNFDPSDLLDFLDTKKKLPGERKPVFPEGVPGLEQGVPKDLYKGSAQEQLDQQNAAQTAAAAPPPPAEDPKTKKSKGKKTKQPVTAAPDAGEQPAAANDPNAPPDANAPTEADGAAEAAPPPPKPKKIVRKRTTAPPPDQQDAQPAQSAQPAQRAAPAQQQSAAPFPAPLPSSTFQR